VQGRETREAERGREEGGNREGETGESMRRGETQGIERERKGERERREAEHTMQIATLQNTIRVQRLLLKKTVALSFVCAYVCVCVRACERVHCKAPYVCNVCCSTTKRSLSFLCVCVFVYKCILHNTIRVQRLLLKKPVPFCLSYLCACVCEREGEKTINTIRVQRLLLKQPVSLSLLRVYVCVCQRERLCITHYNISAMCVCVCVFVIAQLHSRATSAAQEKSISLVDVCV